MDVLPARISQYEIRRVLGRGGMGVVYLAFDPALQRLVALKVLRTDSDDQRERFRREARTVARLQHPNIVAIYTVGEHEQQPFIAMEYIDGEPLSEGIRRRAPWGLQRKLMMGADLCAGLAFAHRAGVIHRDVKPSNLIVSNGSGTVRLLDFGIARGADPAATMGLTMHGNIVGTLNYMSPEQITGQPIDHRSDIFAVGLVLYELVTYRQAFAGDNLATLTYRIVHGAPEPIRSLQPDADEELCRVIERAMARQPDDRYPHLDALRHDLLRIAARSRPGQTSQVATTAPETGPGSPAHAPIWSHALDVTAPVSGPLTPQSTARVPDALPITVDAPVIARPRRVRWPIALMIGGLAAGGAGTIWTITRPDTDPGISGTRNGGAPARGGGLPQGTERTPEVVIAGRTAADPATTGQVGATPAPAPPATPASGPVAPSDGPPAQTSRTSAPAAATAGRPAGRTPEPLPTSAGDGSPPAPARPPAGVTARPGDAAVADTPVVPADTAPKATPRERPGSPAATDAPASIVATPPAPAPGPSEEEQVRTVVNRWARAYAARDARGVDEVQPGSAATFEKQFADLRSVQVTLTGCRVDVQDARATADCAEQFAAETRFGGRTNQTRRRHFTLQKTTGQWRITGTRVER